MHQLLVQLRDTRHYRPAATAAAAAYHSPTLPCSGCCSGCRRQSLPDCSVSPLLLSPRPTLYKATPCRPPPLTTYPYTAHTPRHSPAAAAGPTAPSLTQLLASPPTTQSVSPWGGCVRGCTPSPTYHPTQGVSRLGQARQCERAQSVGDRGPLAGVGAQIKPEPLAVIMHPQPTTRMQSLHSVSLPWSSSSLGCCH